MMQVKVVIRTLSRAIFLPFDRSMTAGTEVGIAQKTVAHCLKLGLPVPGENCPSFHWQLLAVCLNNSPLRHDW
jgi:hypothetical protein